MSYKLDVEWDHLEVTGLYFKQSKIYHDLPEASELDESLLYHTVVHIQGIPHLKLVCGIRVCPHQVRLYIIESSHKTQRFVHFCCM